MTSALSCGVKSAANSDVHELISEVRLISEAVAAAITHDMGEYTNESPHMRLPENTHESTCKLWKVPHNLITDAIATCIREGGKCTASGSARWW